MDVTVALLNQRLALKLPPELPLGLVFVVGQVTNLVQTVKDGRFSILSCDLQDTEHQIHCVLVDQVVGEMTVKDGDQVRAGGHLAFDPRRAGYYLLARQVEVVKTADSATLPTAREKEGLRRLLQDIQKRAAAAKLPPAELPAWLRKLTHLEEETEPAETGEKTADSRTIKTDTANSLSPEMIDKLSEAMDSQEEIELTAEIAAQLPHPPPPSRDVVHAYEVPPEKAEAPGTQAAETTSQLHSRYTPPTRRQIERSHAWWIVIFLLITVLVILAILSAAGFF